MSRRIVYFAPDVTDPAVSKRLLMLRTGGADLSLVGFHRGPPDGTHPGEAFASLGQTFDNDLPQRARAVLGQLGRTGKLAALIQNADVVIARNLEMLVLAWAALVLKAATSRGPKARLIYEVLDVHRSMVGSGLKNRALRAIERALLGSVDLLLVSSPAYAVNYFARYHPRAPAIRLIENKVLEIDGLPDVPDPEPAKAPWRVGWFGMLRCRRSLDILADLSRTTGVEIVIRGRASPAVFGDLAALTEALPGVSFGGAYTRAELAAMYDGVHFVWGLDFSEEGLNSSWLLPNRLYEGSAHGRPVIAQAQIATGAWLRDRNAGVLVEDVEVDLGRFFKSLSPDLYDRLVRRTRAIPSGDLFDGKAECRALVDAVAGGRP